MGNGVLCAETVGSAWLVAVTVAVDGAAGVASGPVYVPSAAIEPAPAGATDQATCVSVDPVTVALNGTAEQVRARAGLDASVTETFSAFAHAASATQSAMSATFIGSSPARGAPAGKTPGPHGRLSHPRPRRIPAAPARLRPPSPCASGLRGSPAAPPEWPRSGRWRRFSSTAGSCRRPSPAPARGPTTIDPVRTACRAGP